MESLIRDYVVEPDVEYGDIPPVFRPHRLFRSGSNRPEPWNRELEVFEKNWLCREYEGTNLDRNGNLRPARKRAAMIREYGLYEKFFQRNLPIFKKFGTTNPSHRPSNVNPLDTIHVLKQITEKRVAGNEASKPEIYEMFRKAKKERTEDFLSDRFDPKSARAPSKKLTKNSMDACISKYCVKKSVNDTAYTEAREIATGDPFLSYAWYLVNAAYSAHLTATNKWNADGSTFVFSSDGCIKHVYRLSESLELELSGGLPPDTRYSEQARRFGAQDFPYAIKVMHLCNAAGEVGPLVAVVAIDDLDTDAFHVAAIPGFANTAAAGQVGYIFFTKTRAGNKRMWTHYFLNILVPCICLVGKINDTHDLGYFFSTDSEDVIISQAFNEDVSNALVSNKIHYARIGASLTSIHQPSDRQLTFKSCKRFVKNAMSEDKSIEGCQSIRKHVAKAFSELREKFLESSISADFESKCTNGLLLIKEAFIHSITPQVIRDGFSCCGQHVEDDSSNSSISFSKMMLQCKALISKEQLLLMSEASSVLVANVRERGTVSYDELIEQGIKPREGYTQDRTKLSRIYHWAEVVTHPNIIAKYHDEVQARLPETLELSKAQKLLDARSSKICQRQLAEEKAELKKSQSIVDKAKDKAYFDSLNPEQRKKVKQQLRDDKELQKKKAAELEAKRISDAEAYIASHQARCNLAHLPSHMQISIPAAPAPAPAPVPLTAPADSVPEPSRTRNKRKRN